MARTKTTDRQYRIMRAVAAGLTPCQIAVRFRTTPNSISLTLSKLRARGYDIPLFDGSSRPPVTKVRIPKNIASQFRHEAKRRGKSPRELVTAIVANAVREGRVSELLGDLK